MKVSEFLVQEISPFLLGAFFGRYQITEDGRYIYSSSAYKKSSKISDDNLYASSLDDYLQKLNLFSIDPIWTVNRIMGISRSQFTAPLENDLDLSIESFYNKLYVKTIESNFISEDGLSEKKKMFIRGFMELRGSIDTNRPYISQDYFFNNTFELRRARLLVEYFNLPVEELNLNFRELQNQFVSGENRRNTQLRINLNWYLRNIGLINLYKVKIVEVAHSLGLVAEHNDIYYFATSIRTSSENTSFETRLISYANNIFGKELDNLQISQLREELNFEREETEQFRRNREIVELVRLLTEDECSSCKNIHKLENRTFTHKRTGRPYFEIHHVVSLNSRIELDDENNLVKLCPVCHSALKRGVGEEDIQKKFIKNILDNSPQALEFSKHIFNNDDFEYIANRVYEHLK